MKKMLLLPLLALIFAAGCVQLEPPEVEYLDYSINRVTADGVEVSFLFDVSNKNPVPVSVSNYTYDVFINNKKILNQTGSGFHLDANAKNRITLPVLIRYEGIFGAALSIIESLARGEKEMDYRIEGTIAAGTAGITASTPLKASGKIKIPVNN